MQMEDGPPGYIMHWSSDKLVHSYGGSQTPRQIPQHWWYTLKGADVRVQSIDFNFGSWLSLAPDAGHFGYIEHVPMQ